MTCCAAVRGLPRGRGPGVTFPALDPAGHVTYVQTRYLQPRTGGPKYENPASHLGANPRLAWTHLTEARRPEPARGVRRDPRRPHRLGQRPAFGRPPRRPGPGHRGSSTPWAAEARRSDSPLVAVIDADPAGRAWGRRLTELLEPTGVELQIVEPPGDSLDLNAWSLQDPGWVEQIALRSAHESPTARTGDRHRARAGRPMRSSVRSRMRSRSEGPSGWSRRWIEFKAPRTSRQGGPRVDISSRMASRSRINRADSSSSSLT